MTSTTQLIRNQFGLDRPAAHRRRVIANLKNSLFACHCIRVSPGAFVAVITEASDFLAPKKNRALRRVHFALAS